MQRRELIAAVIAAPTAVAVALAAKPAGKDVVRQGELQAAIDLHNRLARLVLQIRERLEAGGELEKGRLGVTTFQVESLQQFRDWGFGERNQIDAAECGLGIAPVEDLAFDAELLAKHGHPEDGEMVRC